MKLKPLKQWVCDSCGEIIKMPKDGMWEYLHDINNNLIYGFRIVHAGGQCYYDEKALRRDNISVGSLNLQDMIAAGGFGHMLHWLELTETGKIDDRFNMTDYIEIMRRLYLPHWEEAKQYWERAFKDGFHDACCFSENDLIGIINEYSEQD